MVFLHDRLVCLFLLVVSELNKYSRERTPTPTIDGISKHSSISAIESVATELRLSDLLDGSEAGGWVLIDVD